RRRLRAASQRRQQVVGDVTLRNAKAHRALAVDIDLQRRKIENLRDVSVDDARNALQHAKQLLPGSVAALQIGVLDLDVDRRREAKIQHLTDDVSGLEIEDQTREIVGELLADEFLVVVRGSMRFS